MKTYIIVGGTHGIGKVMIERLVKEGHKVIAMSRTVGELNQLHGVTHHQLDIAADSPNFPTVEGPIDGLIYCPGTINLRPFARIKVEQFTEELNINFLGMIKALQFYLRGLKKADSPSVVVFSTVAVQTGMAFHTSIAGAKGAVEGFVRAFAAEMVPKIRINAVAPSLTETPLAASLLNNDKKRESAAQRHPLKRYGKAEDIANMALFLLSDQASWMTGQIIQVDGGIGGIR